MELLLSNFGGVTKYLLRFSKYNEVRTGNIRSYSLSSLHDSSATAKFSASADTTDLTTHGQKAQHKRTQNSLHIAVIGVPNAGKSTFINNLINHRVSVATKNFN